MITESIEHFAIKSLSSLVCRLSTMSKMNDYIVNLLDGAIYREVVDKNITHRPHKVQMEKYYIVRNMLNAIREMLNDPTTPSSVRRGLVENLFLQSLIKGMRVRNTIEEDFSQAYPTFLTISPTKHCNLNCVGCYANSSKTDRDTLDYDTLSRVLKEKTEKWASHFTVISGGEPLTYRSKGKTILDFYEEHNDNYYLMFTNGTLISERVAKRMGELGNITPAISVEGFEEQTDSRRGAGTYKRILKAMENLNEEGVPFGLSLTATRDNCEEVLSDEFLDFFIDEMGARYVWLFHYMPIGRSFTLDMMVTPEQRVKMYEKEQYILKDRGIFFADFWNSGPISDGCISGARFGGYFHLLWNGDVTPCVFIPYKLHNIYDVYEGGGDLDTIMNSPLFTAIRKWQMEYSFMTDWDETGNQIRPCIIRDHHQEFREILKETGAVPIDECAKNALDDEEYYEGLCRFDEELANLTDPIWEERYLNHKEGVGKGA